MRLDGWEERLEAAIEAGRTRTFAWGGIEDRHDCCTFAARCIDAVTGSSLIVNLACEYDDERTALRFLARHGGLAGAVTHYLGEGVPRWSAARRGDVCLVPTERGDGLGVCVGNRIAVAGDGVELYPLELAQLVWAIE
jgi:hypothetical protein